MNPQDIVTILVNIIFTSIFLIIFFFIYGSYLQKKIVEKQVNFIVGSLYNDISVVSPELVPILEEKILVSELPEVEDNLDNDNRELVIKTSIIGIFVIFLFIVVIFCLIKEYNLDIEIILVKNLVGFIFVGITYYIFSTYIIANYITIDPNYVKKVFIESLVEYENL
jgi:hypothetical protein